MADASDAAVAVPEPPSAAPSDVDAQRVAHVAIADHVGQGGDELSFVVGDTVWLLRKSSETEWFGECNESQGTFPAAKVKLATPAEQDQATAAVTADTDAEATYQRFRRVSKAVTGAHSPLESLLIPAECIKFGEGAYSATGFTESKRMPPNPLLIFVNPKSGGTRGAAIMRAFRSIVNPLQVYDITQGGPEQAYV